MKMTMKSARINAGIKNQEEASKLLNVSKDTISKWERGLCLPNIKYIPIIEKVYGVSYNDIYFFTK